MMSGNMEKILRTQAVHVTKCLTNAEGQPKTKHVRAIILGTFDMNGASPFFHLANQANLQGQPIVCYKFFFVLHKILREGHANCIQDTIKNADLIIKLGKLWGHLKDLYGPCIATFAKLIIQKLKFHRKYPSVPGSLALSGEEMVKMSGHNVDTLFELSADLMDYQDEILRFQNSVFNSLDKSRSNSMTYAGQCRLAPVVQCIQDAAALYDALVKLLFHLHSSLPADMLSGHRERFNSQFRLLHSFFEQARQLQYFKNLIHIPALPETPPNFRVQSELASHRAPVITTMAQPDEPDDDDDTQSSIVSELPLLDLSEPMPPPQQSSKPETVDFFSPQFADSYDRNRDLRLENEALKEEIEKLKARHKEQMDSLLARIRSLENEVKSLVQLKTRLEEELSELKANQHSKQDIQEKFARLRDVYGKLRNEHVETIRKNATILLELENEKKRIDEKERELITKRDELAHLEHERVVWATMQQGAAASQTELMQSKTQLLDLRRSHDELELLLNSMRSHREQAENRVSDLSQQLAKRDQDQILLQDRLTELQNHLNEMQNQLSGKTRNELVNSQQRLTSHCKAAQEHIRKIYDSFNDPEMIHTRCSAELLLNSIDSLLEQYDGLRNEVHNYSADNSKVDSLLLCLLHLSGKAGECLLQIKGTSNSAQSVDQSDDMLRQADDIVNSTCQFLNYLTSNTAEHAIKCWSQLKDFIQNSGLLAVNTKDLRAEEIGDMVDQEMKSTADALEAAERRFRELLDQSRSKLSGLKLEVNESILESCTKLMNAIKVLIEKSKNLQREIVAEGRGTTTTREFYKKHHRWTEGLISAAKAIGFGANILMKEADKVVSGVDGARPEQLEICSREISASTVQLVVTSRVKANPSSVNLRQLMEASGDVTRATGSLVASAKSAAEVLDGEEVLDFSRLGLTQAKMAEMESQVRLLQLESQVTMERRKLAELRKHHYKLASEMEEV